MDNLAKMRKLNLSLCKITYFAFAVYAVILTCSVHCARVSNTTTLHGKCVTLSFHTRIKCSSYTEIPTDITNPGEMKLLDMANKNSIDIVRNGSFLKSKLTSLMILYLTNCKIRVIEPGAFIGANSLSFIFLSDNLITVLNPDVFTHAKSLHVLSISNNPIHIIEPGKTFPNLKGLVTLDLSDCKLDTIPIHLFDNLENLHDLNLSGNYFKHLDWRVIQPIKKLISLSLEGNPWHCDCHVKFFMEKLKNMSLTKNFENVTCASSDVTKWKGELWNQVPDEDMICVPEIDKLVYSSWSPLSRKSKHIERLNVTENLELGQDVYFECEYSGFPKPEVQWLKDNQLIKENMSDFTPPPGNLAKIQPKIEFLDHMPFALQNLEQNETILKFKDILLIRRIQMEDKGTYACVVVHNDIAARKVVTLPNTNIPPNADQIWTMWKWMIIFLGFLLVVLIGAIVVIIWVKRGKREKRGTIQEQSIDLGDFNIKPYNPDLISMFDVENTDTSLI